MTHTPAMMTLLHVTAALAAILILAQLFGRIATRLGQPAVVGEMVAGVVAGPTLLGQLAPTISHALFQPDTKPILYSLSMIGLSLYMFVVGFDHTHPVGTRREATLPGLLALAGLAAPLVLGGGAALWLLGSERPAHVSPTVYALFVGGALSVTAFPMLARILHERGMAATRFGRTATSAAAIDDAVAWCLLALIGSLAATGNASGLAAVVLPAAAFMIACKLILPRIFARPFSRAVEHGQISDGLLAALLVVVLGAGWLCDYIGIYSVFGGFIAGMSLPKTPGFSELLHTTLLRIVRVFFLPIFFAYSGLNTNIGQITDATMVLQVIALIAVAFASKAVPQYALLRHAFGWNRGEAIAMGGLMNARGLMVLIFINAGLSAGLITPRLFSMMVIVAVVTTGLALPLYKLHFTAEVESEARLEAQARPAVPAAYPPAYPPADTAPAHDGTLAPVLALSPQAQQGRAA